jgi:hypothetical protein
MDDGQVRSVELVRSGGQLPTYKPTYKLDAHDLTEADRKSLEALVAKLDLAKLPDRFTASPAPDAFEYVLTVRRDEATRTITFHDMDGHPQTLDELVSWIRAHGRR